MRAHLSLNVKDVSKSVEFYKKVFGVLPQKQTNNYAKFDLKTPALNFSMQSGAKEVSRVSHLGIEVDAAEDIAQWQKILEERGLLGRPEMDTDCCYARQDKIWLTDPDGNEWEIFLYTSNFLSQKKKQTTPPVACHPKVKQTQKKKALVVVKLLFMCVANSARSQMAEGLARTLLGKDFQIQSAGSKATKVNPFAIQVMKEINIDISMQTSKSVESINPDTVDTVITLCAEEVCPVYLGKATKLHWPFPDPAAAGTNEEQLLRFREVRDKIKERILIFKKDLK